MIDFKPIELTLKDEAIQKLIEGAKQVYEAVTATMGPAGRFVVSETHDQLYPKVTKDGVSVAEQIVLEDEKTNLGAQLLIQNARKQVQETGDGTTLTTLLAYEIIKEGYLLLRKGINISQFISGIDYAVKEFVDDLKSQSKDCKTMTDLTKIATISCNNDVEIGKLIAEVIMKVGEFGVIKTMQSKTKKTFVDYTTGYVIDSGIQYPEFINNKNGLLVNDCFVLVVEEIIQWTRDIAEIFKKIGDNIGKTPVVIFCPEIRGEALAAFRDSSKNSNKSEVFFIPWIKPQGFGKEELFCLEDIAAITGATFISVDCGIRLKDLEISHLGKAKEIFSNTKKTIIGVDEKIIETKTKRIEFLKNYIETETDSYYLELAKNSLGKITAGMGVIYVAGENESEQKELKDRIDDAVCACRSALEQGASEGGGVAYLNVNIENDNKGVSRDFQIGFDLIYSIKDKPIRKIFENADMSADLIISKIENMQIQGYTLDNGESSENMFDLNIIDPTKVLTSALINAASIAKLILRSSVLIINVKKNE